MYIAQTNTQPLLFFHTHSRYGYDINCIQGFKGCTAVQRCSLTAAHTKDKWFFTLPQQHVFCLSEYKGSTSVSVHISLCSHLTTRAPTEHASSKLSACELESSKTKTSEYNPGLVLLSAWRTHV